MKRGTSHYKFSIFSDETGVPKARRDTLIAGPHLMLNNSVMQLINSVNAGKHSKAKIERAKAKRKRK
jgi:hypothetical protein